MKPGSRQWAWPPQPQVTESLTCLSGREGLQGRVETPNWRVPETTSQQLPFRPGCQPRGSLGGSSQTGCSQDQLGAGEGQQACAGHHLGSLEED